MPLTLKAFLSHRYQSPAVNTYFHEVFSADAELQFDVDVAKGATNVTRLERMIRDADAFVGIYPYDGEALERPTRAQLLESSKYFRLELELAARARKPAVVFVDGRYGPVIAPPSTMFVSQFDHQEIGGSGGSPSRDTFCRTFGRFCENVKAWMAYERTRAQPVARSVALALPPETYPGGVVDALEARLAAENLDVQRCRWGGSLDAPMASRLQTCDWVITDIGPASANTGFAAYLHGQFVPTLRLAWGEGDATGATATTPLEATLYGAHEVGYTKDIVRWSTVDDLLAQVGKRLARILQESRRIGDTRAAQEYFLEAARLKEPVFVSYSGRDEAAVGPIAEALRRRFQAVFDYRDGGDSIEPGHPWIDEIFVKLDRSAVAVPILSPGYLASGNCLHEARSIVAARDAGKLTMIPVKITRDELDLPPFFRDIQYLRAWEYAGADALVDRIIKSAVASGTVQARSAGRR